MLRYWVEKREAVGLPLLSSEVLQEVVITPDETTERWKELCGLAAVEKDPKRLLELVSQISALLQMQELRRNEIQSEQKTKNPTD